MMPVEPTRMLDDLRVLAGLSATERGAQRVCLGRYVGVRASRLVRSTIEQAGAG